MRPASTQKVLTAISALSVLGAQHEFKTRAYYTGSITSDNTLNGDIYVVGDFDPMYTYSDLKELAQTISDLGIQRINGKIYADASMKNADLYGNGWCWDDVPSKYEPYLCALMVERGKTYPNFSEYSKDASFHPAAHFAYVLSQELSSLNIFPVDDRVAIDYGMKEYGYNGRNFYTNTRTIEQVMQRMLKNSDNLHAEAVFFQLANLNTGRHCSWKDGARQVENVLRKAGVATSYVEVADGSGVSLYNYISPDAQVAMLRYAYKTPSIYQYFYPALPIAGVDGTLDERMRTGNAYRNVHAKTGTLEGVIALSGYVTASNGHQLAFSILINGVLTAKVARDYQDRVCQELAR
jgi:D-alanyl-D-alanine carboxypeptidase/D-alanyl-D-alanine-endopeptidase (penicillin-binding protein 4)